MFDMFGSVIKRIKNGLRSIISYRNIKQRLVGGVVKIKLDKPEGFFYIDVRSALFQTIETGVYEKKIMNTIDKLIIAEGKIINIGANIGFYLVYLAKKYPSFQIHGIEPNPEAFELLEKNIVENKLSDKVHLHNVCISQLEEKVPFYMIEGMSEYSSISKIKHGSVAGYNQKCVTINSIPLNKIVGTKNISLILLDVEGAEFQVLKSSDEIIRESKPIIIAEIDDLLLSGFNDNSQKIFNYLKTNSYKIFDITTNKEIKNGFSGNILAIHESKLSSVKY